MDLSADREANIINAGRTGLKCIPERAALPPMILGALIIFK